MVCAGDVSVEGARRIASPPDPSATTTTTATTARTAARAPETLDESRTAADEPRQARHDKQQDAGAEPANPAAARTHHRSAGAVAARGPRAASESSKPQITNQGSHSGA